MTINGWNINENEIWAILAEVQVQGGELADKISVPVLEGLSADLVTTTGAGAPLNGITGQVPQALNNLMTDQAPALSGIFQRIEAGVWAVAGATTEYVNANEQMALNALASMENAAVTGDLTPFVPYGYEPSTTTTDGPQ